jgi:hypothetical protein
MARPGRRGDGAAALAISFPLLSFGFANALSCWAPHTMDPVIEHARRLEYSRRGPRHPIRAFSPRARIGTHGDAQRVHFAKLHHVPGVAVRNGRRAPLRADYNGLPIANAKRSKNDANDAAAIGEAMTRRRCDLSRSNLNVAA